MIHPQAAGNETPVAVKPIEQVYYEESWWWLKGAAFGQKKECFITKTYKEVQ